MIAEKPSLLSRIGKVAAGSLSVLNRLPQGQTVNDSFSYADNCGPGFPFFFDLFIPSNVAAINYARLSFRLRAFRTYNSFSATATGAGSSHGHGAESGHSHSHTHGSHAHNVPIDSASGGTTVTYDGVSLHASGQVGGGENTANATPSADASGSSGHGHGNEASHTHPVSISSVLGLFEGAVATGVTVTVNGIDRTSTLGGPFNADQAELALDVTWLSIGAWNTIQLTPTGLGRIIGHLRTTFFMQSA